MYEVFDKHGIFLQEYITDEFGNGFYGKRFDLAMLISFKRFKFVLPLRFSSKHLNKFIDRYFENDLNKNFVKISVCR